METDTDVVGEKQPFLTNRSYSNEGKVKFLQIIGKSKGQTCFKKYEKR